jgi:plastocyanin
MKKFSKYNLLMAVLFSGVLASCEKNNDELANENIHSDAIEKASVAITSAGFNPKEVSVLAGGDVTWVNNDQAIHTATAVDGSFNSGDIAPGATFTHKFASFGNVAYVCAHHGTEKGIVNVVGVR